MQKVNVKKYIATMMLVLVSFVTLAQSDPSEDIFVGVVVPLSGTIADLGQTLLNSAELARQAVNDSNQLGSAQLQFVVEDSGGDLVEAAAAFERLIADDRVVAILGPVTSSEAAPAFSIAQMNSMVALSPSAAAVGLSGLGDFAFSGALTLDVLVPGGVALTRARLDYERVAIIVDEEDLFSQSGLIFLTTALDELGVDIVATERFSSGATDFSEPLNRIQASNPDALFVATLPNEAAGILIQAQQLDMLADMSVIMTAFTTADVAMVGDAAEGVIAFSTWDSAANTPGNQAFVTNYREAYGSDPGRFEAQWYAAVNLLATAIEQAGSLESVAIRDALASLRDVDTVLGEFSFDADGAAVFDPIIQIVRDGVLVPF